MTMNAASQPRPKRRWCQVRPWTVLLGLLVLSGCSPSREQQAIDACNRGIAHDERGEYDNAIADYTEALRRNPNDALAYYNRGMAYKEKGEQAEATKTVLEQAEALCADWAA